MQKLIVVRHGHTQPHNKQLDEHGREGTKRLGVELKKYITDDAKLLILTSPLIRAQQTAEILGSLLGTQPVVEESFTYSDDAPENNPHLLNRFLAQTDGKSFDIVIMVTHEPTAGSFPGFFAEKVLKVKLESYSLMHCSAWVVDCEQKTLKMVIC